MVSQDVGGSGAETRDGLDAGAGRPAARSSAAQATELTANERSALVNELAKVFGTGPAAAQILERVGLPALRQLSAYSLDPLTWWTEIFRELENGAAEEPHRRLLEAALDRKPHNAYFQALARSGPPGGLARAGGRSGLFQALRRRPYRAATGAVAAAAAVVILIMLIPRPPSRAAHDTPATDSLLIALRDIFSLAPTSHVAFADASVPGVAALLDDAAAPAIDEQLAQSGYALNGANVVLGVESAADSRVVITSIHPVIVEKVPPVTGAVIHIGSQGDNRARLMDFLLDLPVQPPMEILENGQAGGPFFQGQQIVLQNRGETQTVSARFRAERAAFSFDIEIEYEVDGEIYRQLVPRRDGRPFRASAGLCPTANVNAKLSADEREKLMAARYTKIREYDFAAGGMVEILPDEYSTRCWAELR